ncbi:MAG: hypothetical protein SFV19_00680 [Rhodospirillaceae bacterium]|nr:hypothetical protein [Rhodospirillaceae bacterium]
MQIAKPDIIAFPEWTECREKNGLDPLGMQVSSVNLYQDLLPGISNVTLRIRYYGLYAWLCDAYAKREGDTNPESWKRCLRRAEALYALIAYKHGLETGVAGTDWASRTIENNTSDEIDFATAAEPGSENYYLKQAWGAFGAAYGSQLGVIGITDPSDNHDIPLLSKNLGEPLALAFEQALGPKAASFYRIIQRGKVNLSELDDLAVLAPSEINRTSNERDNYEALLLGSADSVDLAMISRRLSILLILKITELLGRESKPDEVRWILYAGYDNVGRTLLPLPPAMESQRQRWWIYQANDLCHVCLETLLKFALDYLGTFPTGLRFEQLITSCVAQIVGEIKQKPMSWGAFLEVVEPAENSYADDNSESEWSLSRKILRNADRGDATFCTPETAWNAIRLLAILHKRALQKTNELAAEFSRFDQEHFRSLLTEIRFLERNRKEEFSTVLGKIIEERVVRRHLWVAMRKLRSQQDYTFLIEMDNGRIRLKDKDGPVFTNPRLGPTITFLRDIHLIDGQGLTPNGTRLASNV